MKSVVYLWAYYFVLRVCDNKHLHPSSCWKAHSRGTASWSGCNRGTVRSDHTRLVLTRDTTAQDVSE